jgi:hypothetical protein
MRHIHTVGPYGYHIIIPLTLRPRVSVRLYPKRTLTGPSLLVAVIVSSDSPR